MSFAIKFHYLKSWPNYFWPIVKGQRTHELRRNDRDFQIGDHIILEEFDPTTNLYTGSRFEVEITSITSKDFPCAESDLALNSLYCILSVRTVRKGVFNHGT